MEQSGASLNLGLRERLAGLGMLQELLLGRKPNGGPARTGLKLRDEVEEGR
jgi:hypothetical protein